MDMTEEYKIMNGILDPPSWWPVRKTLTILWDPGNACPEGSRGVM